MKLSFAEFEEEKIPPNMNLCSVEIDGCQINKPLKMKILKSLTNELDTRNVCKDAIWEIQSFNLPNRYVRMFKGSESIIRFLSKYTVLDGDSCSFNINTQQKAIQNFQSNANKTNINIDLGRMKNIKTRNPHFIYTSKDSKFNIEYQSNLEFCQGIIDKIGIPQTSAESGICWWGSLWFACTFPMSNLQIIQNHISNNKKNETCNYLTHCLSDVLKNPAIAEDLRRYLYKHHKIGDDPFQNPELDGRNGYSQFSMLCSVIDFPLITVVAPWMKLIDITLTNDDMKFSAPRKPMKGEKSLLGVRNYRSKWKPPEFLELAGEEFEGRRWRLQSAFIGSEWCGHQVSLARACDSNHWFLYDSDGVRLGIAPINWKADNHEEWWNTLQFIIPFSNDTSQSKFCDVNPQNLHPLHMIHELLKAEGLRKFIKETELNNKEFMQVNVDWIYSEL